MDPETGDADPETGDANEAGLFSDNANEVDGSRGDPIATVE
jgi:hypothetical protein